MKVVCWNIRGLKDARKLHRIKSFLSPLKANIIVLTESHANTKTTPLLEKTFLDYQVISTSCSTTPFQRVSALISRDIEVSDILLDHEGRWLRLKAAKGTIAIRLCAVYAPAKIGCREVWFKNNLPLLTKNTDLLLGDFNCILDPATDKFGGSIYKGRQGASVLQKAIMEGGLVDFYHLNKVLRQVIIRGFLGIEKQQQELTKHSFITQKRAWSPTSRPSASLGFRTTILYALPFVEHH